MTSTEASAECAIFMDGEWKWSNPLPRWAAESIAHTLKYIMVERDISCGDHATEAEWAAVWDTLNWLLDPKYDDGWEAIPNVKYIRKT